MKNFYKASLAAVLTVLLSATMVFAQTSISGKVTDAEGNPIPGANVVEKGTTNGTISNSEGNFTFSTRSSLPITIIASFVGYASLELEISEGSTTGIALTLEEDKNVLQEVEITGSGVFGNIEVTKASFAVEKVGILALQASPTAEVFDILQHQKGVQFTSGSLNFNQVNTRGFATISNVRFVQMVDGMDISAPLLNFPTGNIVGIGELDLEGMELLPGTSSGIYGPNAFNGLLLMNSKSPFEYQGLSAQFKAGLNTSDAQGKAYPLFNYGFRYAKAFNNKFAFKVNFNILQGEDWYSNDYKTDVNRPESQVDLSGTENFDGLNLYGDDTKIPVPLPAPFDDLNDGKPLDLRRTGWQEEILLDNRDVKSIKGDIALHYKLTDKLELSYNYRYGGGSSIYQGSQKYALRDFTQQFHKLELKSENFFIRGYVTATDAGDSYNLGALGGQLNENISKTRTEWAPTYAQNWILAMQGYGIYDDGSSVPGGDKEAAHAYARYRADAGRRALLASPGALQQEIEAVRNAYFQRDPAGAKFIDQSRLYHGQFNYNFAKLITFAEVIVGGNFRQYSLFSDGTIFNEDPENGTNFKRININEYGGFMQIAKDFNGVFKLTGSLRYDKNENFEGQVTPRISGVYSVGENKQHNIRASYQTGFRNPDTQAQFIYFPVGTNTLIGSTKANAERYGIFNGGSWTRESVEQGNPVTAEIDYVQPEKLSSFEVGYRGTIGKTLFIDLNAYWNTYTDFQGSLDVVSKNDTYHHGELVPAGTVFSPYVNVKDKVNSNGAGLGITYRPIAEKDYVITGSYSYAKLDLENPESGYRTGFNTPENKVAIGLANRKVYGNLGFSINYRWQESFTWESDFGKWEVPEFGVFDAMLSYKLTSMKTMVKVGGQNIGGGDYRTNFGGPFVGQMYFVSLTFDEFFK